MESISAIQYDPEIKDQRDNRICLVVNRGGLDFFVRSLKMGDRIHVFCGDNPKRLRFRTTDGRAVEYYATQMVVEMHTIGQGDYKQPPTVLMAPRIIVHVDSILNPSEEDVLEITNNDFTMDFGFPEGSELYFGDLRLGW